MFIKQCPICKKHFHYAAWQLKSGRGKYCSVRCRGKARSGSLKDKIVKLTSKPTRIKGCLIWLGIRDKNGYGLVNYKSKIYRVSRIVYRNMIGPIPNGLFVLHKCDRPSCINPDHLFLGTNIDNMADMVQKGRSPRGERNYKAKLTDEQVREIRDRRKTTKITIAALATEYRVSIPTIKRVIYNHNWKHLL